jgi:hypothetical protein
MKSIFLIALQVAVMLTISITGIEAHPAAREGSDHWCGPTQGCDWH